VLSKSSGPYVLGEKVWRKKKRMNIKWGFVELKCCKLDYIHWLCHI
jgi:hypothetical protein